MDVPTLAELLHETAEHHDHFEKMHVEHHWWDWYASYLSARQSGSNPEEAQPSPIATWRRSFTFFPDEAVRVAALSEYPKHTNFCIAHRINYFSSTGSYPVVL
jgi:hypothetical protein